MRKGLFLLLAAASCSGVSMRPIATQRGGGRLEYLEMMSASFEVACDSCRVEYGVDGSTYRDVVDGGWRGAAPLGTLRTGDKVRVVLRVRPIGETSILSASIEVDGRTVASTDDKKPGQPVDLSARVGPS